MEENAVESMYARRASQQVADSKALIRPTDYGRDQRKLSWSMG